jgi:hypothetical protein
MLRSKNPDIKPIEIQKIIDKNWQALSKQQKIKYMNLLGSNK